MEEAAEEAGGRMKDVKHGCASCVHYRLTMKQDPCKRCKGWSEWRDADEGLEKARADGSAERRE